MYRILLVDDEPNILAALRRVLAQIPPDQLDGERALIETYGSPEDALKRASESRFDLVITDFRMPSMNGVEFLKLLIQRQPDIGRMILSGYADVDAVVEAINETQILRFIHKPWHDGELRQAVVQALRHCALAVENRKLAEQVRAQQKRIVKQQNALRSAEIRHPGITDLKFADDGSIIIEDDDDELGWATHDVQHPAPPP
jgi:DNA-binding NtrC family response regulator